MNSKTIIYFLILSLFSSCSDDEQAKVFEGVDERLHSYFEDFEQAGINRGVNLDINSENLVAIIMEIDLPMVAGQCQYPIPSLNRIVIDEAFFKNTQDRLKKELVIFHELGHCLLDRPHRDDAFQNGTCKSIMRSDIDGCLDNYNKGTRSRYLDEMFDPDAF